MSRTIHVISHTHWDREWYFTVDDSKVLMVKAFDEVLDALHKNKKIEYYLLDGQTSILEEYFELRPERKQETIDMIKSGRLITGPWYTQPDVFNIHGESIVRNLSIGMKQAEQFGGGMKIGYLPDSFGFNAQMPLIYSECGIHRAIVRRGYDPKVVGSTEFYWKAADGVHEVLTAIQPFGYSMGHPRRGARFRNFSKEQLHKETLPMLDTVKDLSETDNIMCTIGGDQVTIDEHVEKFIDHIRDEYHTDDTIIQSSLTKYFDAMEAEGRISRRYSGEFRDARFARVHKTIGSSRYDIKRKNFDAEQHLLRVSEVMNAVGKKIGMYTDTVNVERAWKLILESHAHDSMGGCNSDLTNRAVLERCMKAEHTSKGIFAQQARLLAHNIDKKDYDSHFIVVNGSYLDDAKGSMHTLLTEAPHFEIYDKNDVQVNYVLLNQEAVKKPRKIILTPDGEREVESDEYYYISEIAMVEMPINLLGFSTYYIKHADVDGHVALQNVSDDKIENQAIIVKVVNEQLVVINKATGEELKDFFYFEDVADDGDLYDFSPLAEDAPVYFKKVQDVRVEKNGNYQKMYLTYTAEIPLEINETRTARSKEMRKIDLHVALTMNGDGAILFDMDMDNVVDEHRLRLIVRPSLKTDVVTADQAFGQITRGNKEIPENWNEMLEEYPANIEPFQSSLQMSDNRHLLALFAKGCKEYELLESGELAVTLFKGVGSLGKADLVFRPGRESGRDVPTPDGQLRGALSFNLSFIFGEKERLSQQLVNAELERFLTPFASYQAQAVRRDFAQMDYFDIHVQKFDAPSELTLVDKPSEALSFSSVTLTETDQLLVRSINISGSEVNVDAQAFSKDSAVFTNFLGDEVENNSTKVVPTNSAVTVRI